MTAATTTADELRNVANSINQHDLRQLHAIGPSADLACTLALGFYLHHRPHPLKASELQQLGWSRSTVRRRVAELRHLGLCVVSSHTGYKLGHVSDDTLALAATWLHLEEERLGDRHPLAEF